MFAADYFLAERELAEKKLLQKTQKKTLGFSNIIKETHHVIKSSPHSLCT